MMPLSYVTPTICIHIWCCALGKHGFCDVWTFINVIRPSSSTSRMKWYHTSICFVCAWNIAFFAKQMTLWLSQPRTGAFSRKSNSLHRHASHIASLEASVVEIYFPSILDKATTFCSLLHHDTTPPASVNTLHLWISMYPHHLPCQNHRNPSTLMDFTTF